jgi:hypothetical protein
MSAGAARTASAPKCGDPPPVAMELLRQLAEFSLVHPAPVAAKCAPLNERA